MTRKQIHILIFLIKAALSSLLNLVRILEKKEDSIIHGFFLFCRYIMYMKKAYNIALRLRCVWSITMF